MHRYETFCFLSKNLVYLVCVLDLGPLVLIQNVLLRFLYTKVFLEDLRQPWVFLNFSATSALIFYKLVSYIKRVYSYL